MTLPFLAKPVSRKPFDFVDPASCVDLEHPDISPIVLDLVHGANFNDPAPLRYSGYRKVMGSATARWRS